ncbi:hypothetical protein NDU88_008340 [Pleurodeles waltl]|uniref:Uncharacterized protein n=1 Tax=Pleurodeles waltl TaxID=8319 RepID=A0AAV7U3Q8_PLEWA|nr:hypothetical protein NDU88_008339 [Pleurodeles waltl]KAJ1183171.1 hypothetical protein NDU88_008340 [Pleurodeles waltl]
MPGWIVVMRCLDQGHVACRASQCSAWREAMCMWCAGDVVHGSRWCGAWCEEVQRVECGDELEEGAQKSVWEDTKGQE